MAEEVPMHRHHPNVSSDSLATTDSGGSTSRMMTAQDDQQEELESCVLANELRCAGLNPHYRSSWAMTLLKILSYPELIESYSYVFIRQLGGGGSMGGPVSLIGYNATH